MLCLHEVSTFYLSWKYATSYFSSSIMSLKISCCLSYVCFSANDGGNSIFWLNVIIIFPVLGNIHIHMKGK